MLKIFIINAGQKFEHSGGKFNTTITENTIEFFSQFSNIQTKTTYIDKGYDPKQEVKKFVWADYIIYHTPIWWFQLPHKFKEYIDIVFTEGHQNGIYRSDGRNSQNPAINYGKGGLLAGRKYMITSTWNAPATAFTLPNEFFQQKSVDEGVLFGFHRMNAFISLEPLKGYHFHDVEKNADIVRDIKNYRKHLEEVFYKELDVSKSL